MGIWGHAPHGFMQRLVFQLLEIKILIPLRSLYVATYMLCAVFSAYQYESLYTWQLLYRTSAFSKRAWI